MNVARSAEMSMEHTSPLDAILQQNRLPLHQVRLLNEGGDSIVSAELTMGKFRFFIEVNDSDDTVRVDCISVYSETPTRNWISAPSWSNAIGMRIQWFWWLRNNQGYTDGLQIEFVSDSTSGSETFQFIAVASRLSIRRVGET
jgi:hypothetical protein